MCKQAGLRTYEKCINYKSEETIEKAFEILLNAKQEKAVEKLRAIPLEMQFPACAVSKGYGPTYGLTTSNNAEVTFAGSCFDHRLTR